MDRFLCSIGLHQWKQIPNELGTCGMGLEWFECQECKACHAVRDRVRGAANGGDHYITRTMPR